MDRITKWVITIGGVGAILAVSTVCLFLVWVVIPLFQSPSVNDAGDYAAPWREPSDSLIHLSVDEFQILGWSLFNNGNSVVFQVDDGSVVNQFNLTPERTLTAASFSSTGESGVLGYEDGNVQIGRFGVQTDFLNSDDLPGEIRNIPVGNKIGWKEGVLVHFSEERFRYHHFQYELRDPIQIAQNASICSIDHTVASSGVVFCALTDDDALTVYSLTEKKNLLTGKVTYRPKSAKIPYVPSPALGEPKFLKITGLGDCVILAGENGRALRYNTQNINKPVFAEEIDLLQNGGASLTALNFLLGKNTLMAGDSSGRIRGWFRIRSPESQTVDGMTFAAAHDLPVSDSPVTSLASSQRSRVIAAGYENGSVRLFHVTSDRLLIDVPPQSSASVERLSFAAKENGLIVLTPREIQHWAIDLKYPEATLAALFKPVWYEGFPQSEYIWQSSSGTDDFEPKYSLIPLIFGTAKATVYSMLFGVPLALLAAIYTSEFMNPKTKTLVKPTVELMASLPSVVLGFLAALIFAPFVEKILPGVLVSFLSIPLAFMVGAILWQLLPHHWNLYLQKFRFGFILLCLPIGLMIAYWFGPLAESWFTAGDVMAWLDRQSGSATIGWAAILLPLSALATFLAMTVWINPWIRSQAADWSQNKHAWVEALRFLIGCAMTFGGAAVAGVFLNDMGFDPRGSLIDTYDQRNALIVGFVMGFAVIPIIYTIAEDALSSVPEHLRSASLGCGATPWQTAVYVIIPTAMSGLFSAVMIGLGRAVGETMIVLMAAGNTPVLDLNVFNGFRTLSANIAVELPEAVRHSTHYRTLFLAALTLFAMTFVLNTIAEIVRLRFRKRAFEL